MITLDAVAADLHSLADRFDALAHRFDARADEVQSLQVTIARIEERQIARYEAEAAFRQSLGQVPEKLAKVEAQTDANARAIEALDGRGWDRWLAAVDRWIAAVRGLLDVLVGPGGFLRSAPGIAVLVIGAVAVGWLTLEQAMALRSYVPTLVPVPIPVP